MIYNQFDAKVKILRIDSGTKYMEGVFHNYLNSHRILHQISYVNTSAQNEISKGNNSQLSEVAQALIFTMNVPKPY